MQSCSNIEGLVRRFFKQLFPNEPVVYNHRPDWLKYDTGNNLELDLFFPRLNLAVEVQGFQHKLLESQKRRDEYERRACQILEVSLLTVSHPPHLLNSYHLNRSKPF